MYLSEVWKVAWICFRSSFRQDKSLFGSLNFLLSGFRVSFFTTYSSLIQSCRVVVTHSNFVYWDAAVRTNAFLINTQKKKKKNHGGTWVAIHGTVAARNRAQNGGHLPLHHDIVGIRRTDHGTSMKTHTSWAFWQFMKNLKCIIKIEARTLHRNECVPSSKPEIPQLSTVTHLDSVLCP